MASNLVIVESPAKAKTIAKILGSDYLVKPSFGHIRDLAKKNYGIDIEHDFEPKYEIDADKCIDCGTCAETCPVGAPTQA